MANEDVLDDHARLHASAGACVWSRHADALAAALREAREDTRRLDWLERNPATIIQTESGRVAFTWSGGVMSAETTRVAIDAAMNPPGGEGSGHE